MGAFPTVNASRRVVRTADVVISLWVLSCVGIGVWIAIDLNDIADLSRILGSGTSALRGIAKGLAGLAGLPVVGGAAHRWAVEAARTAGRAGHQAATARSSIHQLARLLGIVVAVIPTVPALAGYLPFRVRRARDVRAVRRALRTPGNQQSLRRFLANRALANLGYHRLMELSDDPWEDARVGHFDDLAGAELGRMGLEPSLLRAPPPGGVRQDPALTGRRSPR